MLQSLQIEELILLVNSLDRPGLIEQFDSYEAAFPLDFTNEFLSSTPLERLKHIFVAVCLQTQRMPYAPAASEAA
jgi:hypothetical protein